MFQIFGEERSGPQSCLRLLDIKTGINKGLTVSHDFYPDDTAVNGVAWLQKRAVKVLQRSHFKTKLKPLPSGIGLCLQR